MLAFACPNVVCLAQIKIYKNRYLSFVVIGNHIKYYCKDEEKRQFFLNALFLFFSDKYWSEFALPAEGYESTNKFYSQKQDQYGRS